MYNDCTTFLWDISSITDVEDSLNAELLKLQLDLRIIHYLGLQLNHNLK